MKREGENKEEQPEPEEKRQKTEESDEMRKLREELEQMRKRCTTLETRVQELEAAPPPPPPPPLLNPPTPVESDASSGDDHIVPEATPDSDSDSGGGGGGPYGYSYGYSSDEFSDGSPEDYFGTAMDIMRSTFSQYAGRMVGGSGGSVRVVPDSYGTIDREHMVPEEIGVLDDPKEGAAAGEPITDEKAVAPAIVREFGTVKYRGSSALVRARIAAVSWRIARGVESLLLQTEEEEEDEEAKRKKKKKKKKKKKEEEKSGGGTGKGAAEARALLARASKVLSDHLRMHYYYMSSGDEMAEVAKPLFEAALTLCAGARHPDGREGAAVKLTGEMVSAMERDFLSIPRLATMATAEIWTRCKSLLSHEWPKAVIAATKGDGSSSEEEEQGAASSAAELPEEEPAVTKARLRFLHARGLYEETVNLARARRIRNTPLAVSATLHIGGRIEKAIAMATSCPDAECDELARGLCSVGKESLPLPALLAIAARVFRGLQAAEQRARFAQWFGLQLAKTAQAHELREGTLMELAVRALTAYLSTAEPPHIYELLQSVAHAEEVVVSAARQLATELASRHVGPEHLVTIARTLSAAKFPADALRFAVAAYRRLPTEEQESMHHGGLVSGSKSTASVFAAALGVASDVGEAAVHGLVREYLSSRPPSAQSLSMAQIIRHFGSAYSADALEVAAHSVAPPGGFDNVTDALEMACDIAKGTKDAQLRALVRRTSAHLARMLPYSYLLDFYRSERFSSNLVRAELGIATIDLKPKQQAPMYSRFGRRDPIDTDSGASSLELAKYVVQQAQLEPDDQDTLSSAVSSVSAALSQSSDALTFAKWLREQQGISATMAAMAAARAIQLMPDTLRQIEVISWAMEKVVRDVPAQDLAQVVQALLAGVSDSSIAIVLGKTIAASSAQPAHRAAALECALHALSQRPSNSEPYELSVKLSSPAEGGGPIEDAAAERIIRHLSRSEDIDEFHSLLAARGSVPDRTELLFEQRRLFVSPTVDAAQRLARQAIGASLVDFLAGSIADDLAKISASLSRRQQAQEQEKSSAPTLSLSSSSASASATTTEPELPGIPEGPIGHDVTKAIADVFVSQGYKKAAYRVVRSVQQTGDDASSLMLFDVAWETGGVKEVERVLKERLAAATRSAKRTTVNDFHSYSHYGIYGRRNESLVVQASKENVTLAVSAVHSLTSHGEVDRALDMAIWSLNALSNMSLDLSPLLAKTLETAAKAEEGAAAWDKAWPVCRRLAVKAAECKAIALACEAADRGSLAIEIATLGSTETRDPDIVSDLCEICFRCGGALGFSGILTHSLPHWYGGTSYAVLTERVTRRAAEILQSLKPGDEGRSDLLRVATEIGLRTLNYGTEGAVDVAVSLCKLVGQDDGSVVARCISGVARHGADKLLSFARRVSREGDTSSESPVVQALATASPPYGAFSEDLFKELQAICEMTGAKPGPRYRLIEKIDECVGRVPANHDEYMRRLGIWLIEKFGDDERDHVIVNIASKLTWNGAKAQRAACAEWLVKLGESAGKRELVRQGKLKLFDAAPSIETYLELTSQWPELSSALLTASMPTNVRVSILCQSPDGTEKAMEAIMNDIAKLVSAEPSEQTSENFLHAAEGLQVICDSVILKKRKARASAPITALAAATAAPKGDEGKEEEEEEKKPKRRQPRRQSATTKRKSRSRKKLDEDDEEDFEVTVPDDDDGEYEAPPKAKARRGGSDDEAKGAYEIPEELNAAMLKQLEAIVWRQWNPATSYETDERADDIVKKLLHCCGKQGSRLARVHATLAPLRAMHGFTANQTKYSALVRCLSAAWEVYGREGKQTQFEEALERVKYHQKQRPKCVKMINEWFDSVRSVQMKSQVEASLDMLRQAGNLGEKP